MRELFLAELARVRWLVAIYAGLHLAVLVMMGRMVDLLQQPLFVYQVFALFHMLAATAFGAWQLRSHRRPNAWLFLLHRPVPPARIGAAVLGAGALAAAAAVAVPIAISLAAQASFTVRVVDTRHLGLAVAGGLLAAAAQLAGALLVLGPRRHGFAVLAMATWLALSYATGVWALALQLVVLGWLGALAVLAFRPDPEAVPRRFASALLALPVAVGIALVLADGGALLIELGWIAEGSHPLNSRAPAGGQIEATRAEPRQLLGVTAGPEPIQVTLLYPYLPRRHGLTNLGPHELDDMPRGTRWVFSHDQRRFIGMDLAAVERRGFLDVPGGFVGVPVPVMDLVLDARNAYALDEGTGRLRRLLGVPAGELLASQPQRDDRVWVVLSDRVLRLYDVRDPSRVLAELPLGAPIGDLDRLDVVADGAGHRVSVVTGQTSPHARAGGRHRRYRLEGGQVELLSERALRSDYPVLMRDLELVVSPACSWLRHRAVELFAAPEPIRAHGPSSPERRSWIVAVALSLAAAVFAARRARALGLPGNRAIGWTLAALALGWPMALAFWLVERRPWPRPVRSLIYPRRLATSPFASSGARSTCAPTSLVR